MKKIALILFVLALSLTVAACSVAESTPNNGGEESGTSIPDGNKYVFQVSSKDDFKVEIDQNMSDILTALGEPLSYFESTSCAFEGLDKMYTYAGFIISTRPDGDRDFVNSVRLTDDSVTTPEGIYIGNSRDEVISVYGEAAESSDTLLRYIDGSVSLNITLHDNAVVSIEYLPAE